MCEMLGGALTGGLTIQPGQPRQGGIVNSMLTMIIDADAIAGRSAFIEEIEAIKAYVKASPPAPGVDAVLTPGEPENLSREIRRAQGIPLDEKSLGDILAAAAKAGVDAGLIDKFRV